MRYEQQPRDLNEHRPVVCLTEETDQVTVELTTFRVKDSTGFRFDIKHPGQDTPPAAVFVDLSKDRLKVKVHKRGLKPLDDSNEYFYNELPEKVVHVTDKWSEF